MLDPVPKPLVRKAADAVMQYGWVRFGIGGVLLWGVSVVVTLVTNDSILLPTVVLLGSFVVPVTWVRRAVEHDHPDLPLALILQTFVYGGAAGILSAALLETWLLRYFGQGLYIGVGLIEEAVKLAVLWRVSRRLPDHSMVNGLVLGATVGFGLSAHVEVDEAMDLLAGGERLGYLLKSRVTDIGQFIDTVERITAGASVVDPSLVQELIRARRRRDPLDALSPREREVLGLMAEGASNVGIAGRIFVSEGTVEKHVRSILTKLDLPESDTDHRRVLAVLRFLESR